MRPIPERLPDNDPTWRADLILLAKGLIYFGAKPKIVRRYTGATKKDTRDLYHLLHGSAASCGPTAQGKASFFTTARNGSHGSATSWNIQGAIFLRCFYEITKHSTQPMNKGWLLLQAFEGYRHQTNKLAESENIKRLDINQAYSLLALAGGTSVAEYADIGLAHCKHCDREYLVNKTRELATQPCPFEAMERTYQRRLEICISNSQERRKASQPPKRASGRTQEAAGGHPLHT